MVPIDRREADGLRVEIARLAEAVEKNSTATNALTLALEVGKERHSATVKEVDEIKVGANKDRDELRDWKAKDYYPNKEQVAANVKELQKFLNWKVLLLVALSVGFVAGLAGGFTRELIMSVSRQLVAP